MELNEAEIKAILPHVRGVAMGFLNLSTPYMATLLYSGEGQYWYDCCMVWARLEDDLQPYAQSSWDNDASRKFENLQDRVMYMLSLVSPRTPSHIYGESIVDSLNGIPDENNIPDRLDPDQLEWLQKKLMKDYKI